MISIILQECELHGYINENEQQWIKRLNDYKFSQLVSHVFKKNALSKKEAK